MDRGELCSEQLLRQTDETQLGRKWYTQCWFRVHDAYIAFNFLHVIRRTRPNDAVHPRSKGPCSCRAAWKGAEAHHSWESNVGEVEARWRSEQMKWMLVLVVATIAAGTLMGTTLPVQLWWSNCHKGNCLGVVHWVSVESFLVSIQMPQRERRGRQPKFPPSPNNTSTSLLGSEEENIQMNITLKLQGLVFFIYFHTLSSLN